MRSCGKYICNPCSWKEFCMRRVSFDAVCPLFAVPILTIIAAQNLICHILVFVLTPIIVYYVYRNFLRLTRTRFFLMWTITSVLMLMLVFEEIVVPLLEILPEENLVFKIFVVSGLVCGYKTRTYADQSIQENTSLEGLELGESNGDLCIVCHKKTPFRAYHCKLCQTCILGREYHCKWLDCCIGANNLRWYMGCLFSSSAAFLYGSNLTMTTVCHPFAIFYTVLLPDDCSDVYYELQIAICFVSSVYSLLIGLIAIFYLFYHLWLLYLGTTTNERRLLIQNQHNEGVFKKAAQLICCNS